MRFFLDWGGAFTETGEEVQVGLSSRTPLDSNKGQSIKIHMVLKMTHSTIPNYNEPGLHTVPHIHVVHIAVVSDGGKSVFKSTCRRRWVVIPVRWESDV